MSKVTTPATAGAGVAAAGGAGAAAGGGAASGAAPAIPGPPGLKRQPSIDDQNKAATKMQAFMRGAMVRATNKDNTLFQAWSQLDWRDESDLMESHENYVKLVEQHKLTKTGSSDQKLTAAAEPAKVPAAGGAAAAAPAKTAPPSAIAPPAAAAAAGSSSNAQAAAAAATAAGSSSSANTIAIPGPPTLARKPSHGQGRTYADAKVKATGAGKKEPESGASSGGVSAPVTPTAAKQQAPAAAVAAPAAPAPAAAKPADAKVAAAAAAPANPPPAAATAATKPASRPPTPPAAAPAEEEFGPGPFPKVLTLDYVTAMMDWFKANEILELSAVEELLKRALPIMRAEPNVRRITIATKVTVVGDIHGQLDDLFEIFSLNGLPSDRNVYIFNGDFVDRGHNSLECVLTLLAFKVLYPDNFFMNRGNHEARDINSRDGFEKECRRKYNGAVFDTFSAIFAALPMAHIIDGRVFVVHGGLFNKSVTLDELDKHDRFHEIPPAMSLLEQMLWNDPDPAPGIAPSSRGGNALYFGPDVVDTFLQMNKLERIIRSHECVPQGFESMFDGKLYTVFSASNYTGSVHNDGAYIVFQKDCVPHPVTYYAGPKEGLTNYRMRHALEHDVINRLLHRISDERLALIDHFRSVEATKGLISRQQWADGLKKVLRLDIPFLEFQDILGLPKRDVAGGNTGIDYMAFLARFKPVNSMFQAAGAKDVKAQEHLEKILALLSKNRYELESLFRHFDQNGDGEISTSEFREGLISLFNMLKTPWDEHTLQVLIKHMDKDGNGTLSYEEFFGSFEVLDPALAARQRELRAKTNAQRAFKRQKSSDSGGRATSPRSGAAAPAAAAAAAAAPKKTK